MEILKKPIVTEKLTKAGQKSNTYGFKVDKKANKIEIKQAVESMYSVKVSSVRTMVYGGKIKTRYTKSGVMSGKVNAFKKAVVTLAAGDSIDFYSNI